jgi:hypothetical protein
MLAQVINETNMSTISGLPSPVNVPTPKACSHARRLIVLVPEYEVYHALLARRIWTMALAGRSEVLYVALVRDADEEAHARRGLALLASLTRDDRLRVATNLAFEAQWLKGLRPLYQPGDEIVCLAEMSVKRLGRSTLPLSEQLRVALGAPVHALDGISVKQSAARREVWPMIRNAVPFAILAGFLKFQMWATTQLVNGAAGNVMLAMSVVVEFSLIWLWVNRVQ